MDRGVLDPAHQTKAVMLGGQMTQEIYYADATELAGRIADKELSSLEVVQAHVDRVEDINPKLNAIVQHQAEEALTRAKQADTAIAQGESWGPLHGVPFTIKDCIDNKGVKTTRGSKIFENHCPDDDASVVKRLTGAGGIFLGKTNMPEFALWWETGNEVYGFTENPWMIGRTSGGSSGGSAAALASGLCALATGSDAGGSIRIPASFCGVYGIKPTLGRVPALEAVAMPAPNHTNQSGPMSTTVKDAAILLQVLAGPDDRDVTALRQQSPDYLTDLQGGVEDLRIAWSPDLGGLPVDSRVTVTLEKQREVFEDLGCIVEEGFPDFVDADKIFKTFRAWFFELKLASLLPEYREKMKKTVIWNIESGMKLSGPELGRAEVKRTALFHRVREFMKDYDFLALPVSQVPPFPLEQEYVSEINGMKMETYLDWMRSCYSVSYTHLTLPTNREV